MARCGSICCNRLGAKRQAWVGVVFGIVAACISVPVFELVGRLDIWVDISCLLILPMDILATVLVVRNSCKGLVAQIAQIFLLGVIFTILLTITLYYGVKGIKASQLAVGILLPPWVFVMLPLSIHHLRRPQEQVQDPRAPARVGRLDGLASPIDPPPIAYIP